MVVFPLTPNKKQAWGDKVFFPQRHYKNKSSQIREVIARPHTNSTWQYGNSDFYYLIKVGKTIRVRVIIILRQPVRQHSLLHQKTLCCGPKANSCPPAGFQIF